MEVGKFESFADELPFCIEEARDVTAAIDRKAVVVEVLTRELPGFSESCAHDGSTLEVQLITGYWMNARPTIFDAPRFAGGQIQRNEVRVEPPYDPGPYHPNLEGVAVAQLLDRNAGGSREEAMRKAAMLLVDFLKTARAKRPQSTKPQP